MCISYGSFVMIPEPYSKEFDMFFRFSFPLVFICGICGGCHSPSKAFDLPLGQASVVIDGEGIEFESTWTLAGSTLQINLEDVEQGSMMMIRLLETDGGLQIDNIKKFPATFSLGDGQKGSATFYPSNSSSSATSQDDDVGHFEVEEYDSSHLVGNFSCSVEEQNGQTYNIGSGYVHASKMEL